MFIPRYGNALTAAAHDGRLDILEILLVAGADVMASDGYGIQIAAAKGHEHIVMELLKHKADVNALTTNEHFPGGTAIQGAAEAGEDDMVKLLLAENADPNLGSGENAPPLFAAATNGHEDIISMLIDAGAMVNVVGGEHRSTPLIEAVGNTWGTESLEKLLDAGADIHATNKDGETALMVASSTEDLDMVRCLLHRGADVMYTAPDGMNALKAGIESSNKECLDLLVEHVSYILSAVRQCMHTGNTGVTVAVQDAIEAFKTADEVKMAEDKSSLAEDPDLQGTEELGTGQREVLGQDEQSTLSAAYNLSVAYQGHEITSSTYAESANLQAESSRHRTTPIQRLDEYPQQRMQSTSREPLTESPFSIQRRPIQASHPLQHPPRSSAGSTQDAQFQHRSTEARSAYQEVNSNLPRRASPLNQDAPFSPIPAALRPGPGPDRQYPSPPGNTITDHRPYQGYDSAPRSIAGGASYLNSMARHHASQPNLRNQQLGIASNNAERYNGHPFQGPNYTQVSPPPLHAQQTPPPLVPASSSPAVLQKRLPESLQPAPAQQIVHHSGHRNYTNPDMSSGGTQRPGQPYEVRPEPDLGKQMFRFFRS